MHDRIDVDIHHVIPAWLRIFCLLIPDETLRLHEHIQAVEGRLIGAQFVEVGDIDLRVKQAVQIGAFLSQVIARRTPRAPDMHLGPACKKPVSDAVPDTARAADNQHSSSRKVQISHYCFLLNSPRSIGARFQKTRLAFHRIIGIFV